MKKTFFTFFILTISYQNYSQTSQSHLHNLRDQFWSLAYESGGVKARMINLAEYSTWNSGEHLNMGQANLANNWNSIREAFLNIEQHFSLLQTRFHDSEYTFNQLGSLLGNFDGSYPSLTDRIFYYDSNNNNGIYSNQGNTATGTFSFAIGSSTSASGSSAVSLNHQTAATGNASLAIGSTTQSIGENSFAGGFSTQSTGYSSAALGRETVASGNHSLSIGQGTNSHAFNSVALGQYNSVSNTANPDTYLTTNTALVIGNGTDANNRSNAFKVLFDGTTTVAGSVTASSFIGDGGGLTNLPTPSLAFSDLTTKPTTLAGYGITDAFDGNFSSLSGTPTTLAGYGIIDGFSGNYSDLSGKPTFRDLSSSSPVVFGSLDAFGGTFSNRATIDVIADSNGDLITGYKNGASGDRFNVKLDTENESAIVSSGGGYELKLYSESGEMTFEGMDMDGPVVFSFNGKTEMNGDTVIEGTATADLFIGDGSGLTNVRSSLNYVEENGNWGVRLDNEDAANHGDIGNTAVDLSHQDSESTIRGATGNSSLAIGMNSTASGDISISGGYLTIASGDASVALGNGAQATGTYSYSIGHLSKAKGDNSVALGFFNESDGQWATSMGIYTNAVGDASTSIGHQTVAKDYASLVLGQYNLLGSTVTNSSTSFSSENTALVIGNGADGNNRSDALVVKFDGTTTIAGDLSINSDARLKANIISLGATLSKLLQIDGKSYTMKKDKSEKQKIGLLAQDIEKVFPELVSESNGIKSVNYQGLVPVLINALKEQDVLIKEQQRILSEQQSEVDELKSMMQKIIEKL